MKKVILFLGSLMIFIAMGCEKDNVTPAKDIYQNSPSSTVPPDFKDGSWFWGTIGALSYYDADGNDLGNDIEAGRQIKFYEENGQGRMEFNQYLGTRNSSNCVTEIYTHKKGTIKFKGQNKYTFYPVEGTVRIVKSGKYASCSKENKIRQLANDQLTPENLLYEIRVIQGEKLLYVFEETDINHKSPLFVYTITK